MIESLLMTRLNSQTNGFKNVQQIGNELLKLHPNDALEVADELYALESYQARMCAVHIYGILSVKDNSAYETLNKTVAHDSDWRVQEMLAKAFDYYCAAIGYKAAMPTIRQWITSDSANTRRAVSEGLRIWTNRPYFCDHPKIAITLLASLKDDKSLYVRTSAGNALRDISKKYPKLVLEELKSWDSNNPEILATYKLASKFIAK